MDLEDDNKEKHDGSNRELSNGLIISGLDFGSIFLGSVLLEFVRVIVLMALLLHCCLDLRVPEKTYSQEVE